MIIFQEQDKSFMRNATKSTTMDACTWCSELLSTATLTIRQLGYHYLPNRWLSPLATLHPRSADFICQSLQCWSSLPRDTWGSGHYHQRWLISANSTTFGAPSAISLSIQPTTATVLSSELGPVHMAPAWGFICGSLSGTRTILLSTAIQNRNCTTYSLFHPNRRMKRSRQQRLNDSSTGSSACLTSTETAILTASTTSSATFQRVLDPQPLIRFLASSPSAKPGLLETEIFFSSSWTRFFRQRTSPGSPTLRLPSQ